MAVKINIQPNEVWQFYKANSARLKNSMVPIAEDDKRKIKLCLTDGYDYPRIVLVESSTGKIIEASTKYMESSCCEYVSDSIFANMKTVAEDKKDASIAEKELPEQENIDDLVNSMVSENTSKDAGKDEEAEDEQGEENDREIELYASFLQFLATVCDTDIDDIETCFDADDIGNTYEDVLEFLAVEHGIMIRRPIVTDDGEVIEYPYDGVFER